jgi:hypothetical protein
VTPTTQSAGVDVRALAEAVVDVLIERGIAVAPMLLTRVLTAAEVARMLRRDRQWVYDHAAELGGFRYGDGPKARLGFDWAMIERWKRRRRMDGLRVAPPSHARGAVTTAELIPYDDRRSGAN